MNLLELAAIMRDCLQHLRVFLSEFAEGKRSQLSIHILYLGVGRRFQVSCEAKLQGLESAEGKRSFEVVEASIVDGKVLAVPEVMNEGLVKLLLVEVVSLQLYLNLMILQILGVELLIGPKVSIDLIQL